VIRVPFNTDGTATGSYGDFLTGFVTDAGYVWGRPVGIAWRVQRVHGVQRVRVLG